MPNQKTLLSIFLLISVLLLADITYDLRAGNNLQHVFIEVIAVIVAGIPCGAMIRHQFQECYHQESLLKSDLEQQKLEKEHWKAEAERHLRGLGESIDAQFNRWGFSEAEKDIGLLILKGLNHKEISAIRGTSEKTVRQQAGTIYAKAGVEGKLQLAAFFLEDL